MYLKGDRREIDRLILFSINRLTACIVPHTKREEEREAEQEAMLARLGGISAMADRALFVDALIKKQGVKNAMMEKVSNSSLSWAFVAFLGFLAVSVWDAIVAAVKLKLGS